MVDIDTLNTNLSEGNANLATLNTQIAAITPATPVDLTGAIAASAAIRDGITAAGQALAAKIPPAQ